MFELFVAKELNKKECPNCNSKLYSYAVVDKNGYGNFVETLKFHCGYVIEYDIRSGKRTDANLCINSEEFNRILTNRRAVIDSLKDCVNNLEVDSVFKAQLKYQLNKMCL